MIRPFFFSQCGLPVSRHARRIARAFNPFEGTPSPIPRRRPASRRVDFAVGESATPQQERAMRNLWWDGFFAESSELIWLQYFTVYALVLGAGASLIGVLAAMGGLVAALSMWPGAAFAEKTRQHKFIVLLTGGGIGRFAFLILAAIPWIATGNLALGLVTLVAVLRGFFGSVAMPAWNAFVAEFVPERLRGRYFSSRNFARQLAGLGMTPLVGFLIYRIGGFEGWQVAWLMAFVAGMVSSGFFLRIPKDACSPGSESERRQRQPQGQPSALRDRNFLWFVGASGLFNLFVMLAGPFFAVYLVQELGASTLWVGITAAATPLGGIVAQPIIGKLNDRLGAKWLLVASGLTIPVLPWLWIIATEPWHIVFLNLLGGVLWAANLLATFNLVLAIAPPDKRPSYSGLQQGAVFFASFLGPLAGGFLISLLGFHFIFFLSGAGRVVATILLWRLVSRDVPKAARGEEAAPHSVSALARAAG
jgi:MFS family permease